MCILLKNDSGGETMVCVPQQIVSIIESSKMFVITGLSSLDCVTIFHCVHIMMKSPGNTVLKMHHHFW